MKSRKNSVLIVDDERDNISSLKAILYQEYTVYASTSGKDAIETAEEFMPDIILLDVLMPDMDGYDVITVFKNSEKMHDIPIIFITGLDNINAEIKGLALGAVDYLSKPFHPAIVKLRVQHQMQLVQRHRQQALINSIAHNFLLNAHAVTLFTDTLRMVGEFMGITTVLLYKLEIINNTLICQNEWISPDSSLPTRIGDKVELNDQVISVINGLLAGNDRDLCIHSGNPLLNGAINLNLQHLENYIATPIFIRGKFCATIVFSREEDMKWNESETNLAILLASIFSGVFERDAIQHAEYLSRTKSEFLSRMSHEMRTPLNAIIGMLQILNIIGIPDNIKENCNVMNNSAHDLLRMIDAVLDISDTEYGALKLSDSVFNFDAMIREILLDTDKNATRKQQMFGCKIDSAIPTSLTGDEKRLKQVITTLLENAVKFTPENGDIFFDARKLNEVNGIITIQFKITDNGIGITKEQQNKLFSVFEQADNGLNRKYSGIGIGLALSKRIIEMMGGNIWVESELGKGSEFCFTCNVKR
ncbi:MAG: ATP-binding protein [Treponema sp.]|nr:ATP-binding protein [Treponema sp.]